MEHRGTPGTLDNMAVRIEMKDCESTLGTSSVCWVTEGVSVSVSRWTRAGSWSIVSPATLDISSTTPQPEFESYFSERLSHWAERCKTWMWNQASHPSWPGWELNRKQLTDWDRNVCTALQTRHLALYIQSNSPISAENHNQTSHHTTLTAGDSARE